MSKQNKDAGNWYCRNCGYLSWSRVTYYETCDICHQPVKWHDLSQQSEVARLRQRVQELETVLASLEIERDNDGGWIVSDRAENSNYGVGETPHKALEDYKTSYKELRELLEKGEK